jgi:hypothetical protein
MNTRINETASAIGVLSMPMKALNPPTISAQGNVQVKADAVGITRLTSFLEIFERSVPHSVKKAGEKNGKQAGN